MTLLLALATGCTSGPYGAPIGSTVLVDAEQTGYLFDLAYNDPDDGVGLLMQVHAWVYDEDELPLNDVLVEVTSGWGSTYVIPSGAVKTVDSYEAGCEGDASEECKAWYDIGLERYVEFSGDYEDLGGFKPTYLSGSTDSRGVFEFFVFVDSLPVDDEGVPIPIPMFASIGVDTYGWTYDFAN